MNFFDRIEQTLFTVFFVILGLSTVVSYPSYAQSPPVVDAEIPDSCDPDYMDILNIRGYLEGKRELETAQRIILKPDSVLEYSCFHEESIWYASYAGRFSEYGYNPQPGNPAGFDGVPVAYRILPNSLDNALGLVVQNTMVRFLDSFSHIYGGGTYPIAANPASGCNPMNIVWHTAKCQNFDPNWWVRFENLASADIRVFPIPCAPLYDPNRTTNINTAIGASYPAPATPAASGGMDSLDSHLPTIRGACGGGIDTGVNVTLIDGTVVDDAICIQPKCHYTGTTCTY